MSTYSSRRWFLLTVSAAGLTGLAGCSGDGDGPDDTDDEQADSDDTGPSGNGDTETDPEETANTTPTATAEASNVTGDLTSDVEKLDIVDWRTRDELPEWFSVTVVVENTGDQETDAQEYNYEMTIYDTDGNDITDRMGKIDEEMRIAPGEKTEVNVDALVDGNPDDVDSFELTLSCGRSGSFGADGVYCE